MGYQTLVNLVSCSFAVFPQWSGSQHPENQTFVPEHTGRTTAAVWTLWTCCCINTVINTRPRPLTAVQILIRLICKCMQMRRGISCTCRRSLFFSSVTDWLICLLVQEEWANGTSGGKSLMTDDNGKGTTPDRGRWLIAGSDMQSI